jgi:hypothetical protein
MGLDHLEISFESLLTSSLEWHSFDLFRRVFARCVWFPLLRLQHAVKLRDKTHQLIRIHLFTGSFSK